MVISCWVKGCSNRLDGKVKRGFYSIPTVRTFEGEDTQKLSDERRRLWLSNINRKDTPSKYAKICSDHFVHGKPANLFDRANPDWAPTLKLCDNISPRKFVKKVKQVETDIKRYKRAHERQKTKEKHHVARALLDLFSTEEPQYTATPLDLNRKCCPFVLSGNTEKLEACEAVVKPLSKSQSDTEVQRLLTENMELRAKISNFQMCQESFVNQDERVKYYTGLPNYLTLMVVFDMVASYVPTPRLSELGKFERLIMTLMRLKLNLPVQDLAYRFQTSVSTVSRTFVIIVHVMYMRLKNLLYWPEREELRPTMPIEFRRHFGLKTAVIIDCFEVFIQRPSNLMARAQTWSSYKHNNTVKFLIGITPQCSCVFFVKGIWRETDSVGLRCAQINIPSFTKGRSQLSPVDVETTRKIAHVRIHVERVIGLVRNKYTMLQDKLPIDYLMTEEDCEITVLDKIATVACALTNLCPSVVSFN
ncbi:hypothetical protein GQR58_006430 [Nymphon striatum]|nr:hypothetical protein GQR58_006430 [Nymphon striatum]